MKSFFVILIGIYFSLNINQNHSYEYCLPKEGAEPLCTAPHKHFICDQEQVKSKGEVVGTVPMTAKLKKHILHYHNAYRNNTACGAIEKDGNKYSKGTRMRRLIWDDELAYIATIHAQRCNMAHDKCRNTRRHPLSGQNLAYRFTSDKKTIFDVAIVAVTGWYDEYKLVNDVPGFAATYPSEQKMEVGHFTQLVNDRTSRVGCGITLCKRPENEKYHYHTSCNYDYTNIKGQEVYDDKGDMGSKCGDWGTELSSEYECLCENSGEMFQNNNNDY